MKMYRSILPVIALLAFLPLLAKAQALAESGDSSGIVASMAPTAAGLVYVRPTEATKLHNYVFDTFGPYPLVGAAFTAGINQAYNTPPEWKQGFVGYSKRFGSNFGIAAVSTTVRYGLAEALRQDTVYYGCSCKGFFPRLRHAVFSTLTARQGRDGHTVFSFPALVAPYAGTMTGVYAWYPSRYNGKDALRMGNYLMLGYVGGNVALEFLYGGPHSLLSHVHLGGSNDHTAETASSKQ